MNATKPRIKPLVIRHEGESYIRSTNFADVFEKRHSHVKRSIENLQDRLPNERLFGQSVYTNSQNHEYNEFLISEEGFRLLTQNYTTDDQQKRIRQYQTQFNQHRQAAKPSKFSSLVKPMDNWNWPYVAYPTEGNGNGHGYIVGEVYINCFWYYAKPGDIVVDPMAGSGMAKRIYDDRALWMKDHVYDFELHLFDLTPQKPYIQSNNLLEKFPLPYADYIFMDIPYFGMVQQQYSEHHEDLANIEEWGVFVERLWLIAQNVSISQTIGKLCTVVTPNYRDITTGERYMATDAVCKAWEANNYILFDKAYTTRRIQKTQHPSMARLNNTAKEKRVMLTDISEVLTFKKVG